MKENNKYCRNCQKIKISNNGVGEHGICKDKYHNGNTIYNLDSIYCRGFYPKKTTKKSRSRLSKLIKSLKSLFGLNN